jgi:hypothetical protein
VSGTFSPRARRPRRAISTKRPARGPEQPKPPPTRHRPLRFRLLRLRLDRGLLHSAVLNGRSRFDHEQPTMRASPEAHVKTRELPADSTIATAGSWRERLFRHHRRVREAAATYSLTPIRPAIL